MTATVVELHAVHPMRPDINGRSFSDIAGLHPDVLTQLCAQELVFTTAFARHGKEYGGFVIARDWATAERIAARRGFGEVVNGQLVEVIGG